MGIRFQCPACGAKLNVKAELAGKRGACPKCQAKIQIPAAAEPEPAASVTSSDSAASSPGPNGAVAASVSAPAAPVTGAGEARWFVRPPSGGQYGPAAKSVLSQWVAEGRITPDTLVWREGDAEWKPASAVFDELAVRPVPNVVPTPVENPATPTRQSAALPNVPGAKDVNELDAASAATAMLLARRKRARSTGLLVMGVLIILVLVLLPVLIFVLTNQNQSPSTEPTGEPRTVGHVRSDWPPRWASASSVIHSIHKEFN